MTKEELTHEIEMSTTTITLMEESIIHFKNIVKNKTEELETLILKENGLVRLDKLKLIPGKTWDRVKFIGYQKKCPFLGQEAELYHFDHKYNLCMIWVDEVARTITNVPLSEVVLMRQAYLEEKS